MCIIFYMHVKWEVRAFSLNPLFPSEHALGSIPLECILSLVKSSRYFSLREGRWVLCCVLGSSNVWVLCCVLGSSNVWVLCCVLGSSNVWVLCCVLGSSNVWVLCCVLGSSNVYVYKLLGSPLWAILSSEKSILPGMAIKLRQNEAKSLSIQFWAIMIVLLVSALSF